MSENYPSDVKLNENQDGTVSFATEVVATIAGLAATEVDGVASMSSPSSGFADMFSRKNTRNFTKGVRIDLDGNKVTVEITIVVEYGSPVPEVARNIQENVKKAIETMAGLDVKSVDIHVSGISFEREQKANAELDAQHRKMLEKTAETSAEQAAPKSAKPAPAEEAPAKPAPAEEKAPVEEAIEPEEEEEEEEEIEDDLDEEDDDDFEDEIDEEEEDEEDEEAEEDEEVEAEPEAPAEPEPVIAPRPEPVVQRAPAPVVQTPAQPAPEPVVIAPPPIEEDNYEDIEEFLKDDDA